MSDPTAVAPKKRERLRFASFACHRSPAGRTRVEVELEFRGKRFSGTVEGSSSAVADLRIAADAAARALQAYLAEGPKVDLVGVKLVRGFDADVAIVSVRYGSQPGQLVGCCLADRDPVRAAALAVLNATNRLIEIRILETGAAPPQASV